MLFPQTNAFRSILPCSALWKFKPDPENCGEEQHWQNGFDSSIEIAVPGSWNEQLKELGLFNYIGSAWYETEVYIPAELQGKTLRLRVGSADYSGTVWVNGLLAGCHDGGFLPFDFDITPQVTPGRKNRLSIRVNNELRSDSIPQGIMPVDYQRENRLREETFPPTRFDFFPFGGIHRPVMIYSTPTTSITAVKIDTAILSPTAGGVQVTITATQAEGGTASCTLTGNGAEVTEESAVTQQATTLTLHVDQCRFWSPEDPFLYRLTIRLLDSTGVVDEYEMSCGVREISITEGRLLLNGNPIYLKGFGRHEDFPVLGKAFSAPLLIKDFNLMKWINANSFRTSHYPYSEETMELADRRGFLIIDEVPAVSLDFRHVTDDTLAHHKQAIRELIERDYNHPSVIAWALGNEPNLVGDPSYASGPADEYWKEIFQYAASLDSSRPRTVPNCAQAGCDDPVLRYSDFLAINRYYGWYEYPGQIDTAIDRLKSELCAMHEKYGKPVMMTEFGADTIPGLHSTCDQIFTEEYQMTLIGEYIKLLRALPFMVGEHVWNFADFQTAQHFRRVVMNMKGVFTRTRDPKAAAMMLKNLWAD